MGNSIKVLERDIHRLSTYLMLIYDIVLAFKLYVYDMINFL